VEESAEANDQGAELRARIELAHHHSHHHTPSDSTAVTELIELATEAIPTFENLADDRGLGRAWLVIGSAHGNFHLRYAAQEEAAERAAHYYRLGGWSPSSCLSALMNALYYGPRPVGEAIAYSEHLLQEHAGDTASEANVLQWLGGLEAMRARFADARTCLDRARSRYEGLGLQFAVKDQCAMVLAEVEMLAGRAETGTQRLREACDACMQHNESAVLASRAAQLADALYSLGQYDEAEEWMEVSRQMTDAEDLHAQASWRGIASRLAARRGDVGPALRLIKEAGDIVGRGDGLNQQAKLQLDFAEVCRFAEREGAARHAVERAIELYEAKENDVAASSARTLLETSVFV